jgi:hypothetical protein
MTSIAVSVTMAETLYPKTPAMDEHIEDCTETEAYFASNG